MAWLEDGSLFEPIAFPPIWPSVLTIPSLSAEWDADGFKLKTSQMPTTVWLEKASRFSLTF